MFNSSIEKQFLTTQNPTERQKQVAKLLAAQVKENRTSPDIVKPGVIPRSIIQHKDLNVQDLIDAGFKKSLIAVPETGQSSLVTYRHPTNNLHFHKHPENWLFHEDKYPALSMVMERYQMRHPDASFADKTKYLFKKALPESMAHIVHEGFPGWVNWIASTISGSQGLQSTENFNTKDFLTRVMAGATGLSATEFALSKGTKGLETLPGNAVALAGMVAGNQLAKNIYTQLSTRDKRFQRPGVLPTTILAGIPLLTALAGKYGTNAIVNKLIKKDN